MLAFGGIVLTLASAALGLLTVTLAAELLAARKPTLATTPDEEGERPGSVILVPAHDEESQLPATLQGLDVELGPYDKVLVVADNCTDGTADVARAHGADVIERQDSDRRGKGYALKFGLDHLAIAPPDVVIVLDADCRVSPGSIERLARSAASLGRPVQGVYLMEAGPDASLSQKLSAFAFLIKNQVRPTGLRRLGLPCPLTGTGMAFPWEVLSETKLDVGNIVEDMKLGLDLAAAGHPPLLEDRARITSDFPTNEEGRIGQRRRWEHGHLATIASVTPALVTAAIRSGRPALLAVALDLAIPPLSLLVVLLATAFLVAAILAGLGGAIFPIIATTLSIVLAMVALIAAWRRYGRSTISAGELLSIPIYVLRKLPIYLDFFRRRQRDWVRAERGNEDVRR
jgi:cellulose synthase/poly-beta-1,6-N-acetylglucosamine synthase-like glycosyltransferase